MASIVTVTINPTIDKSTSVDSVASEIKMRCDPPTFDPGGGGINVSRAVKKLGGDSTAIYTAGGAIGEMLTDLLHRESITTQPIPIQAMTRQNLTVFETTSTLQYRFGMPGPVLTNDEIDALTVAALADNPEYAVLSGSLAPEMPEDYYLRVAREAKKRNIKVIIDTSGAALEACKEADVFLMKPNLRELEILSGQKFSTEARQVEIAQQLIRGGMAQVLVISMGSAGAMMVTADEAVSMRPPVVPIQSKVGAGDSMVGGLVWSLANGDDLQTAVRYGIAAGSAAVMTPGTELCRKHDVLDIFERVHVL